MNLHLNKWLDPYEDTTCDQCGERKERVRPRKTITVGLKSGILRWKFCEECAAKLTAEWLQSKEGNATRY
jgi:hypothetical protein